MRIGYISYEHPLGVAGGGIGTYLGQIARLMSNRGHDVEVFTAHPDLADSFSHDGYLLHRVKAGSIGEFRSKNVAVFAARHTSAPFDVIEAAEYGAEALGIKKRFPALPFVVKLHTPSYLTHKLNEDEATTAEKMRFILGSLVRGKLPKPYWIYKKEDDVEYEQYTLADALCSPSRSLANLIKEEWPMQKQVAVIPNPFVPDRAFLAIPPAEYKGGEFVVSFFGRLEKRKGILDLMKAIPLVLEKYPNVVFRFAGKSHPSPIKSLDMEAYLKQMLAKWQSQLRFLGYQPYQKISGLLAETHVCVFPSLWENFPNVCLEAMAAGRAVIASNSGGMTDMIENDIHGLLIPPNSPESVANAILSLLQNPSKIRTYGEAARQRVLNEYNENKTGELVTAFYTETISQSQVKAGSPDFA